MQDMSQLQEMGMISDDYMKDLKKVMRQNNSLESFGRHLDEVSKHSSQEQHLPTKARKAKKARKRKLQKLARRKSRAHA